jgi:uncharacterized protein YbjT (DUF2867 family)
LIKSEELMTTLIIGSHGQIGRKLTHRLAAEKHPVRAMVRKEEQLKSMEVLGAEPVLGDLEGDFAQACEGCEAVVFTAGSGGHTGPDKTLLIDLWGALKAIDCARQHNIARFIMVSSRNAGDPDSGPAKIRHYLVAKHVADDYLMRSGLDYTILRPGRLSNDAGTGRIQTTRPPENEQWIPREDVAAAIHACLLNRQTAGKIFELYQGATPIEQALND